MKGLLITSLVFSTLLTSSVFAAMSGDKQVLLSKEDMTTQAVDICRSETEQRYGESAIKFIAGKSSWSNDLQGAMVKMKIKPEAKKPTNYYCLVKTDLSVDFILR
jgi:hypothetical protein